MQPWSDVARLLEQARAHLVVCVGNAPAWLPAGEHWEQARRCCVAAEMEARAARWSVEGDVGGLRIGVIRLTRAVEALDDARRGADEHTSDVLDVIAQGVPLLLARVLLDCREIADNAEPLP